MGQGVRDAAPTTRTSGRSRRPRPRARRAPSAGPARTRRWSCGAKGCPSPWTCARCGPAARCGGSDDMSTWHPAARSQAARGPRDRGRTRPTTGTSTTVLRLASPTERASRETGCARWWRSEWVFATGRALRSSGSRARIRGACAVGAPAHRPVPRGERAAQGGGTTEEAADGEEAEGERELDVTVAPTTAPATTPAPAPADGTDTG